MRLQGIDTIEQANDWLPTFIKDYNQRFAVDPQHPHDAHREVLHSKEDMALILSRHHTRKLSKNLTCQFHNTEYQLQGYGKGYRLRGATITVCEGFDGHVTLLHKGRAMTYRRLQQGEMPIPIADDKSVQHVVEQAKQRQQQKSGYKPAVDHPWRRYSVDSTS